MLMNEHDKTDKELERLFDRALSELPLRRAPEQAGACWGRSSPGPLRWC